MQLVEQSKGCLELTRPVNALVSGLLTFIGAFVAGGETAIGVPIAAAVAATVCAVGAGNAINDYFDRDIDQINAPERPIPRGAVRPRQALWFSIVLFAGATLLALTLPTAAIAIAAVNLVALVAYTKLFKGLPGVGNLVVAFLGGSTFLFGAAAVGAFGPAVFVLFALASLSTVTREIVKDVEDIEGDREEGLRTLPLVIGKRRALHIGTVSLLLAVLGSPLPYVQQSRTFGIAYLIAVTPAVGILLLATWQSYGDPTTGQRRLKIGMFCAALAFVVGRIAPAL
jgi:geranylgeranylglycerol-phosphate geranylgeranyltransferase